MFVVCVYVFFVLIDCSWLYEFFSDNKTHQNTPKKDAKTYLAVELLILA